jgi:ubiquinone/menaquinone biosynthesis C-methylase UbiE
MKLIDDLLRPGMRVLDLGCGSGRISTHLVRRGASVVGCDLSGPALRELQAKIPAEQPVIIQGDARHLPFRDCLFDAVVFAFAGLDYVCPEPDRFRTLREIERVLVPGGRCRSQGKRKNGGCRYRSTLSCVTSSFIAAVT